jgi:hypothetical protein
VDDLGTVNGVVTGSAAVNDQFSQIVLTNKTNAQVAAFFTSLFKQTSSVNGPPKVDA